MEVSLLKPQHCNRLCCVLHTPPHPPHYLWDNKVKPNKNKSIFDTKGRIIFNFKFEISVEKIWSDRRTKCISFQISFQNQTTEHLLQRQQSRAMCPSQCMTYANFPWCYTAITYSISSLNQESLSAIKGLNPSSHLPPLLSFPHKTELIS